MKSKLKTMNTKQVIIETARIITAKLLYHSLHYINFHVFLLSLQIVFMIIKDTILAREESELLSGLFNQNRVL